MEQHDPIQDYLDKMKLIQTGMLKYIDNKDNAQDDYLNLSHIFEHLKIQEDPHKIKSVFYLITRIADNHHRGLDFFKKIEQVVLLFKDEIPKFFTNSEIFNIFKSNKRIVLILLEQKLLSMDKSIATVINSDQYKSEKYSQYFYPEIKPFLDEKEMPEVPEDLYKNYADKRKNENNENEICRLIQKNSADEFDAYVKKENIQLTQTIEPSIFNTDSFLTGKLPSLIEYAAFCGSFQIFNYLYVNHVHITESAWIYSIHGGNIDIIHLLETCKIKPIGNSFLECLIESIKAHENEMTSYILKNLMHKEEIPSEISMESLKYFNFELIDRKIIDKSIFYDLCEYGYYILVKILLDSGEVDVNLKKISELFSLIQFQFNFNLVFLIISFK